MHDSSVNSDRLGGTDPGVDRRLGRGTGHSSGAFRADHDPHSEWKERSPAPASAFSGDCRLRRTRYSSRVVGRRSFYRLFRRSAVAARSRRFWLPAGFASEGKSVPEKLSKRALQPGQDSPRRVQYPERMRHHPSARQAGCADHLCQVRRGLECGRLCYPSGVRASGRCRKHLAGFCSTPSQPCRALYRQPKGTR